MDLLVKPNPIAVLYIEQGSLARAQRMSQFVREQELEDPTQPLVWVEKARSEIIIRKHSPIFLKSFLFETVNHERLIVKVEIYSVKGDKHSLFRKRHNPHSIDLKKQRFIGEQIFRLYDIVRNNCYETKALRNFNPK